MSQQNLTKGNKNAKKQMTPSYLAKVALLSAIAFLIMYFEFAIVALFPEYLKIDLSEVVVFIGGVVLGPLAVIFIELIKNILFFIFRNSGGVGELANFTVGVALVLPAVLVVRRLKHKFSPLIGFAIGVITMVVVASIANYFIFLPLWGIGNSSDRLAMIIPILVPFNATKGIIVAFLSISLHLALKPVYKHLK